MRSIAIRLLLVFAFIVPMFGQTQIDIDTHTQGSRLPFFGTDTGTASAYAVATVAPVTVLRTGSTFIFKAVNASTGASTLTVSGFSSHPIKKNGATAIAAGDIGANQVVEVVYDGTNFQLIGPGVVASTPPGGSTGDLQYNNAGAFGGFADGTSHQVLHGGKTFSAVDVASEVSGLLPNANLANPSTTVNGTACTLGSACSPTSSLTSNVSGTLPVANGGTGTGSTLVGLVRGSGSAMTAAELSGDASTSGSNAVTLASVVTPGSCGDATHSCAATYDAKGRVTSVSNVAISGSGGGIGSGPEYGYLQCTTFENSGSNHTSQSCASSVNEVVGDDMYATCNVFISGAGPTLSFSNTHGDTWTTITSHFYSTSGYLQYVFHAVAGSSGADTFTCTISATNAFWSMSVSKLIGISTGVDVSPCYNEPGSGSTVHLSCTITTLHANELAFVLDNAAGGGGTSPLLKYGGCPWPVQSSTVFLCTRTLGLPGTYVLETAGVNTQAYSQLVFTLY